MLKTCDNCGRDFLTEADIYVYQNRASGEYFSCGCAENIEGKPKGADSAELLGKTVYLLWNEQNGELEFRGVYATWDGANQGTPDWLKGVRTTIEPVTIQH